MTDFVKKNGVNFGILVGIISILIYTILYSIDLSLLASVWVGIIIFLINLGIGIYAVAKSKKEQGGFISFKEAFTAFFIVMAIGSIINSVFMFVLFNLIDPEAKATISEIVIEKTVTMMQNAGLNSEDIRRTAEEMQNTDNFSALSLVKSYFSGLVLYIIIALIVAAAFKKNKPEFEN